MKKIIEGYCQCGCGNKTIISPKTLNKYGWIKGKPRKYLPWHNNDIRQITKDGYIMVKATWHPKCNKRGYISEHILIVEKVLGYFLPEKAVVHHIDGNPSNNDQSNLMVCQNNGYHHLLHKRERALKACGHAHWLKCPFCKKWDSPENLWINGYHHAHIKCKKKYAEKYYFNQNMVKS